MRLLGFADKPPPADAAALVEANRPDLVVTLGDLRPEWIRSLASLDVPRIGVHGNHDEEDRLWTLGIRDLHLRTATYGDWSFSGFEGCVEFGLGGPRQYTQREARRMVHDLPPADVLLCHCPPYGIDDEPDDPAHIGFEALREWVERHEPRYLLHGHTTPDPRTRVWRFGRTEVVWVRGSGVVELRRDGAAGAPG